MKKTATGAAILLTALLLSTPARAEFAVGMAQEVVHARDTQAVVLRYDCRPWRLGGYAMAWKRLDRLNGAVAVDFNAGLSFVDLTLGGAYIPHIDDINGTRWNFSLRAAFNFGRRLRLQYTHISDGKGLFKWADGKKNLGWNFLGLSFRF